MNKTSSLIIAAAALAACAPVNRPNGAPKADVYNISEGKPVPIEAKKTDLPLIVYGEGSGKSGTYVPSGYMGDTGALKLLSSNLSAPLDNGKPGKAALKIKYTAKGPAGWAGVYWLSPANNWAKIKGAGYDLSSATKLTFWAKGERGGERIAEIKVGGILGPYPDTDSAGLQGIKLTDEWKKYEVDLTDKDMRHIVGGFMFSLRRPDSPRGETFYLDEIRFETDRPPVTTVAAADGLADESMETPADDIRSEAPAEPVARARATNEPTADRWMAGVHVGYAFLQGLVSDSTEDSPAVQVALSRRVSPAVIVGLEVGQGFNHRRKEDDEDGLTFDTSAELNWLEAAPFVRFHLVDDPEQGVVYAIAGLGAYNLHQNQDGPLETNDPFVTVEFEGLNDTYLGGSIGMGAERRFGSDFSAGIDLRYHRIFSIEEDYAFIMPSLTLNYLF